jgi:hypothetical protein
VRRRDVFHPRRSRASEGEPAAWATVDARRSTPWWTRASLRLPILLLVLAALAVYGVPRIARQAQSTSAPVCAVATFPAPVRTTVTALHDLLAVSGLPALAHEGAPDVAGLQAPAAAAWSDAVPQPERPGLSSVATTSAGYEVRWWGGGAHRVVDLFAFATDRDAARYVAEAASARCRAKATSSAVVQPSGGRALVWHNPLGYRQVDVYFARGRRAYRVGEVPPTSMDAVAAPVMVHTVARVACRLPEARCADGRDIAAATGS